jgi:cytochrome c551/c552
MAVVGSLGIRAWLGIVICASACATPVRPRSAEPVHYAKAQGLKTAHAVAQLTRAGLRIAMLSGNGITVRDLLEEIKSTLPEVKVRIYAPSGEEVYRAKSKAPAPATLPMPLRTALESNQSITSESGSKAVPIFNELRCQKCHEATKLRGVISYRPNVKSLNDQHNLLQKIGFLINSATMYMMTTGHALLLDDYFTELSQNTPGVVSASLLGPDGESSFGDPFMENPERLIKYVLQKGPAVIFSKGDLIYYGLPIANSKRCHSCHRPDTEMRGALASHFKPKGHPPAQILEAVLVTSLRHIMLSGLGRILKAFLNDVYASGLVTELKVYDNRGRVFHDVRTIVSPPYHITQALWKKESSFMTQETKAASSAMYTLVLANEDKCQRCHGVDDSVRGVIEIEVPIY